jgi:hypothetical protein
MNIVKEECLSESIVQSEMRLDCWQFSSTADAHRSIESLEFWYSNMNIDRTKIRWIWFELAIKTRSSYDSTIRSYRKHCMIWDFLVFSTIIESLRSWVFTLDTRELKTKSIKAYLTEIRFYHVDMKHLDETLRIFHSNVLQRMINEIKRVHEKSRSRERLSIVRFILMQFLETLNSSTLLDATLHSTFILTFAVLLRLNEITWIEENIDSTFSDWHVTRENVLLKKIQLRIILSTSKTNLFRLRIMLIIAATNDFVCAIALLKHLFRLFSRFLTNSLFFLDRTFIRSLIIEKFKIRLQDFDHQDYYSRHSFKRDAVIWAKERDLSIDDIKLLDRWKSNFYKLYLEFKKSNIMSVFRRMQRSEMTALIN